MFSGDGGFNEVLNGPEGVSVGFLPGGGTSVLPRALGLPRDPVAAARQVADALEHGRERRISLGRVNGRRFGFSAGIGLDAELVRRVDALGGGTTASVRVISRTCSRRCGSLGEPVAASTPRSRCAASGARPSPSSRTPIPTRTRVGSAPRGARGALRARPRPGRPGAGPAGRLPRLLRYAFAGRGQDEAQDVLYGHDLDRIEIVCDRPLPLQVDGEDLGDVQEAVFEAERDAIAVLI